MKRLLAIAAAVLVLAITALPAQAAPLYSITNATGLNLGNPPFTLGSSFTVNTAMQLTALGFFDDGSNGLAESHQLGLWNSSGTLLATATVNAGVVDPLNGQFRYASIVPVTLLAGQSYTIGAVLDRCRRAHFPRLRHRLRYGPEHLLYRFTFCCRRRVDQSDDQRRRRQR